MSSGGLGAFQVDLLPHSTGHHGSVREEGDVAGEVGMAVDQQHGLVDTALGRRRRQSEIHFLEFGFNGHGK